MVGDDTKTEIKVGMALTFLIQALRHPTGAQQTACIKLAIDYLQEAQATTETPFYLD